MKSGVSGRLGFTGRDMFACFFGAGVCGVRVHVFAMVLSVPRFVGAYGTCRLVGFDGRGFRGAFNVHRLNVFLKIGLVLRDVVAMFASMVFGVVIFADAQADEFDFIPSVFDAEVFVASDPVDNRRWLTCVVYQLFRHFGPEVFVADTLEFVCAVVFLVGVD